MFTQPLFLCDIILMHFFNNLNLLVKSFQDLDNELSTLDVSGSKNLLDSKNREIETRNVHEDEKVEGRTLGVVAGNIKFFLNSTSRLLK